MTKRIYHWAGGHNTEFGCNLVAICGHTKWGTRKTTEGYIKHGTAYYAKQVTCEVCSEKVALLVLAETDL